MGRQTLIILGTRGIVQGDKIIFLLYNLTLVLYIAALWRGGQCVKRLFSIMEYKYKNIYHYLRYAL